MLLVMLAASALVARCLMVRRRMVRSLVIFLRTVIRLRTIRAAMVCLDVPGLAPGMAHRHRRRASVVH